MVDMAFPIPWVDETLHSPWALIKLSDLGETVGGRPVYSLRTCDIAPSYRNIAGAATTTVKSGAGRLYRLTINKTIASSVITIFDNTTNSGTKIATITQPLALLTAQFELNYGLSFTTGLTIVTSAADDITVVYS